MSTRKILIEEELLTRLLGDVECLTQYVEKAASGHSIAWKDLDSDIGADTRKHTKEVRDCMSETNNHSDQLMTKQEFNERLNLHERTSRLYALIATMAQTKATDSTVGAKVRELLRDYERESLIIARGQAC